MPNHITNLISFGDQPEQVAAFHQMLRDLRQKDGVYGSIDFNKLIPMPKALDIESGTRTTNGLDAYRRFITGDKAGAEAFQKEHPEEWALGKQAYENIQQYGSPTWYEWCNKIGEPNGMRIPVWNWVRMMIPWSSLLPGAASRQFWMPFRESTRIRLSPTAGQTRTSGAMWERLYTKRRNDRCKHPGTRIQRGV